MNKTVKNVLIIGFGSIGRQHASILQSISSGLTITVLSAQEHVPFQKISKLTEIEKINPDYIVIASNTSLHFDHLCYIENNFSGKLILIEKPLFDTVRDQEIKNNTVYVGYHLRFDPALNLIREMLAGRKLWTINVICGSYLPEWRSNRDYRNTSSARLDSGGGVLLDMSHELDYLQWLCGKLEPTYVSNGKISDLEIETDDFLLFCGHSLFCSHIFLNINYYSRHPIRQIVIDGEGISIQADLLDHVVMAYQDGKSYNYTWPNVTKSTLLEAEHRALLSGDTKCASTYLEGVQTMKLIESIRRVN